MNIGIVSVCILCLFGVGASAESDPTPHPCTTFACFQTENYKCAVNDNVELGHPWTDPMLCKNQMEAAVAAASDENQKMQAELMVGLRRTHSFLLMQKKVSKDPEFVRLIAIMDNDLQQMMLEFSAEALKNYRQDARSLADYAGSHGYANLMKQSQ